MCGSKLEPFSFDHEEYFADHVCVQPTTMVCLCFAYCHLYLLVLRLRPSHHIPLTKGYCVLVSAPSNDCSHCSIGIHAYDKDHKADRPLHSRTKGYWISSGVHSLWILPRMDKTICTADTSDGKLRLRSHMLSILGFQFQFWVLTILA